MGLFTEFQCPMHSHPLLRNHHSHVGMSTMNVRLPTNYNTSINNILRFTRFILLLKLCICQHSMKNYLLTYIHTK